MLGKAVFITTKGRTYDSVLYMFMYFMEIKNKVFTDKSLQNKNKISSFCGRDVCSEQAIRSFPPNMECVWTPHAPKGHLGSRSLSLDGHSDDRASGKHHQDQTPTGPDKTSLESLSVLSPRKMLPM